MITGDLYTAAVTFPQRRATDSLASGRLPVAECGRERFIDLKEVKHMTSLSTATIYRKMAAGQFPKTGRIGSRVVWRQSAILAWMDSQFPRQ